jgi:hypothetical protein
VPVPLDGVMPVWDVRSSHAIDIAASPERVFDTLAVADFSRNPIVRSLMALRSIPAIVLAPRKAWRDWRASLAAERGTGPLRHAFVVLESRRPDTLILGLTGRFWTPSGGLVATDPASFGKALPGFARAAWSFELVPTTAGTRLSTETRVLCGDPRSRRRFLRYWRVIRPGSGVIRRVVLRQIKVAAERA